MSPKTVEIDLSSQVPPFSWNPVVVDSVPEDPGGKMHFVIVPAPDDPKQWMKDNVPKPSHYVAVMFVPVDFMDIEQVRQECREFEFGIDDTFPPRYRLIGCYTMLDSAYNIVVPS